MSFGAMWGTKNPRHFAILLFIGLAMVGAMIVTKT